MQKILIIKLGYSETLVNDIGITTSLGDVLRSTVILPSFKDAHVTWLTDIAALPLLEGHKLIDRLMTYDLTTCFQLQAERFDQIINLEKIHGVCAYADSLHAWRRNGFRFEDGEIRAYDGSHHILEVCDSENKGKYWEQFLFEMIGGKWDGEIPSLGYKPKTVQYQYDVGFNTDVGKKFPEKAWPDYYWLDLQNILGGQGKIYKWQQGKEDLIDYIEWIASCKLIVTSDSLGLHIAHALGTKMVALFGPTDADEIYLGENTKIQAATMEDILPETVAYFIK